MWVENLAKTFILLGAVKYRTDPPFTLSSGQESPWYFDVKSVLLNGIGNMAVGTGLAHRLVEVLPPKTAYIAGGPANAAYLLVGHLLQNGVLDSAFVVRKETKGHGLGNKVDGVEPREGDNVVVLEDVITTGKSLVPTLQLVERAGATLVAIVPVVDRNEGDHVDFASFREQGLVKPLLTKVDFALLAPS